MRFLVLLVCVVSLLSGCDNLPKSEMKRVDATSIILGDSRFPREPAGVIAKATYCGFREFALWKGNAGRAEIYLSNADEGCIIYTPLKQDAELALYFKWLKKTGVRFEGEPIKTDTALGAIWGRRFMRENRECYFFRHDFEAYHTSYDSDPTTYMTGYFCAKPGDKMDAASIRQFVSSISLGKRPSTASAPGAAERNAMSPEPHADRKYRISGHWDGVSEQVSGTFYYLSRETTGSFVLNIPGRSAPCSGTWTRTGKWRNGTMSRADWMMMCDDLPAASGNFYFTGFGRAEMRGTADAEQTIRLELVRPNLIAKDTAETRISVPFSWDGVASAQTMEVTYMRNGASGSISFSEKSGSIDCEGLWFLKGRWIAQCTNGQTISGDNFRFQHGSVSGTGTDDLGRTFRFGKS